MVNLDRDIQKIIREDLTSWNKLIKAYMKNSLFFHIAWKKMTVQERAEIARGLVLLNQVAKQPKKFLGETETQAAWKKRVEQYQKFYDCNLSVAHENAYSPCDIVYQKAFNALHQTPYAFDYYDYLVCIQNYEYCHTPLFQNMALKNIMESSESLRKVIDKEKNPLWLKALKMMKGEPIER